MGNCCGSESSTVWATLDEWEFDEDSVPRKDPVSEKEYAAGDDSKRWASLDEWEFDEDSVPRKDPVTEKEYAAGDDSKSTEAPAPSKEQLKLTITKELAELMGNARQQGVPVDRLFSRLIAAVDLSHVQRQRSWAPTLHSIAE